ncbi:MAG: hypothetical protein AB7N76_23840 [Planctomycetota bacterium]
MIGGDASLDVSWQMALAELFKRGAQAGSDYVFTYGPLGFLHGITYDPRLFPAQVTWGVGWAACASLLLTLASLRIEGRRRQLLFAAIALLAPPAADGLIPLALLAGTLLLTEAGPPARLGGAAYLLVLSLLALIKFTFLVAAGLSATALLVHVAARAGLREALLWLAWAILAYFGGWLACGQSLASWPAYLGWSLEVAAGYSEGMASRGSPFCAGCGALAVAALSGGLLARTLRRQAPLREWIAAVTCAGLTAIVWKHGFVRQDDHVIGTLTFLSLAPLLLWRELGGLTRARRRLLAACVGTAVAAGLIGQHVYHSSRYERPASSWPAVTAAEAARMAGWLLDLPGFRASREAERAQATQALDLPRVRAAVGEGAIDALSVEQGRLLLLGLRYRNRPVLQGYSAYTPGLARLNADFLAGRDAPDYLLLDGVAIDGHLQTQDDGPALVEALRRYELVLVERGYPLLRRRSGCPPAQRLLLERSVALDEELDLSGLGPGAKVLVVDLRPSLLGRLRRVLWRATEVELKVTCSSGEVFNQRIVPGAARAGFLIDPLPRSRRDLALLCAGEQISRVRSVQVYLPRRRIYYHPQVAVQVWSLPLPDSPRLTPSLSWDLGLGEQLGLPLRDLRAGLIPFQEDGLGAAVLAHAPEQAVVELPERAARLEGRFGLRPGSYTGGGATDGVTFRVESLAGEVLWERRLEPLRRPADRGPQTFGLDLPAGCEGRLRLRTLPGPNDRWDWSYWAGMRALDAAGVPLVPEGQPPR